VHSALASKQLCNQDCVMNFVVHALHCHPSATHTAYNSPLRPRLASVSACAA